MLTYDPDNGSLDIDMSSVSPLRLRLCAWNDGLGAERIEGNHTERYDGDVGIPLTMLACSGDEGRSFAEGIPGDVRRAVAPFAWRQWILLRLLRRDARTREMLATAPALVWLVADAVGRERVSLDEAADLLVQRRRIILERLGLPAAEWVVRLISRVRFARYLPDGIEALEALVRCTELTDELCTRPGVILGESLRILLRNPEMARLSYARPDDGLLSAGLLDLLAVARFVDTLRLSQSLLRDIQAMVDEVERADLRQVLGNVHALEDLRALHDRLAVRIRAMNDGARSRRFEDRWGTTAFPPPPLPGDDAIVPITSFEELAEEGRMMRHCVGSYGHRVMSGSCYIYRVMQPERATLELMLRGRKAIVGQLKLAGNQVPSKATRNAVERWLAANLAAWPRR